MSSTIVFHNSDCLPLEERINSKRKGERKRCIQLNADFQKIARRDKKVFFNEQCLMIEENNKKRKTRDLFRKIGNIKGIFCPKMGTIKDKHGRDLVDTQEIKKRWKDCTAELHKKYIMNWVTTMVWLVTQSQTF